MTECKCDLRTKLVGDGCRYCNPQEYIDHLIESLEEQRTWVWLTDDEIEKMGLSNYIKVVRETEAKLKEKNGL